MTSSNSKAPRAKREGKRGRIESPSASASGNPTGGLQEHSAPSLSALARALDASGERKVETTWAVTPWAA